MSASRSPSELAQEVDLRAALLGEMRMPECDEAVFDGMVQLVRLLNAGSFATVWQALDLSTSPAQVCAVKCIYYEPAHRKRVQAELDILQTVSEGPNIVRAQRVFQQDERVLILMDLYGANLTTVMNEHPAFFHESELRLRRVMLQVRSCQRAGRVHLSHLRQVVDAVAFVHSVQISHRDIKLDNIVFKQSSNNDVVLVDFGLATKSLTSSEFGLGSPAFVPPGTTNSRTSIVCGSRPPRSLCTITVHRVCVLMSTYGVRTELKTFNLAHRFRSLWALGIVLFELATSQTLWAIPSSNDASYASFVDDGHVFFDVRNASPLLRDTLLCVFAPRWQDRMALADFASAINRIFSTDMQAQNDAVSFQKSVCLS